MWYPCHQVIYKGVDGTGRLRGAASRKRQHHTAGLPPRPLLRAFGQDTKQSPSSVRCVSLGRRWRQCARSITYNNLLCGTRSGKHFPGYWTGATFSVSKARMIQNFSSDLAVAGTDQLKLLRAGGSMRNARPAAVRHHEMRRCGHGAVRQGGRSPTTAPLQQKTK